MNGSGKVMEISHNHAYVQIIIMPFEAKKYNLQLFHTQMNIQLMWLFYVIGMWSSEVAVWTV